MGTKLKSNIDQLFDQWKSEHAELDNYAMELARWIRDQTKRRDAQFREAVTRLNDLSSRLADHFAIEQTIGEKLIDAQGRPRPETESLHRQADRDHANIKVRLKHLSDRMLEAESECDAWKSSGVELNLILDMLEQHEEQEAESVGWLLPRNSDVS